MNGYNGKILHVDLTTDNVSIEEPCETFYRKYLGGHGFTAYYLLKEVPRGTDPLGPENVLVFAGGTFTGFPIFGGGRNSVGAKSPLSGGYGTAEVGGFFGAELMRCGYDAIVIKGQSKEPVYLSIIDGEVSIKSAHSIWGMKLKEAESKLKQETGSKKIRTAMIGPAGENQVRYACIMNDLKHAAGRTGLGAVMGSKKLKAIVVLSNKKLEGNDPETILNINKWMGSHWKEKAGHLHEFGSAGNIPILQKIGALPTRNHQMNQFEGAAEISGQRMSETILEAKEGCFACGIRCKRKVKTLSEDYSLDGSYGGPEYETVGAFGSNCGIDDLEIIAKANEISNSYGVDTITAGGYIAYVMECMEKGFITKENVDGLDVRFGNGKALLTLLEKICLREGIGKLLAETPETIIQKWGEQTRQYFMVVKGQSLPMHEGRIRHGHAFGYAMSPTGADHMHNFWDHELLGPSESAKGLGLYDQVRSTNLSPEKVHAYAIGSTWSWIHNMICNCMYVPWNNQQLIELINAITGWKTNQYELMKTSERALTLARVFNLREGLTDEDDNLPMRYYQPVGSLPGISLEEFNKAKSLFYALMGWSVDKGTPSKERLLELSIAWAEEYINR